MKHTCPHCGKPSFTPLQKARCGGMSSAGKPCQECGVRCVNGKASLIVNSVLRLIAFIMIIFIYFAHEPGNYMQVFWFGVVPLIAAFVLGFLFDMFFGKLVEAIKRV